MSSKRPRPRRAPGKVILSGAYSVLWGAPAIVSAVDRYAIAYPAKPAEIVSDEVRAAIELGFIDRACKVDVSALRAPTADGGTRKLGLGSSAAIVVATLAALGGFDESIDAAKPVIFTIALQAHKLVQPDGSGVDVAASTFGGTIVCRNGEEGMSIGTHEIPAPVRVFASRTPSVTKDMLARVRAFESARPDELRAIIGRATEGAERAAVATRESDLLEALRAQDRALRELAAAAEVPIFTPEFDALAEAAEKEGAFFGPSGAGGGDIGIRVGSAPAGEAFATALARVGVDPLDLTLGASGVEPHVG